MKVEAELERKGAARSKIKRRDEYRKERNGGKRKDKKARISRSRAQVLIQGEENFSSVEEVRRV